MLEAAQRATGLTPNKARALLGRFLFSGEEAEKPLAGLSGGERRRLSLAVLVNSGANVLILDEPTNHLDIESREALEDALRGFEGAVLLVSHDRALLDAVGTRTVAVEGAYAAQLHRWLAGVRARARRAPRGGGSAGWERRGCPRRGGQWHGRWRRPGDERPRAARLRGRGVALRSGARQGRSQEAAKAAKPKPKGPSKNRLNDQQKAELAMEEAEAALRAVEDELADPAAWASKYESAKSEARHTAARRAVEAAYARLEALVG